MITLLSWAVIILAVLAAVRLMRIYELSAELRGGKPQWEITESDNRMNAVLMMVFAIAFFAFCFWVFFITKDKLLPLAASVHGAQTDWLFNFNMVIITAVAIITNFCLFYFAFKYYKGKKNDAATFFPESHKLELIWTVVPGIALTVIIFLGIKLWNNITAPAQSGAIVMELYAKQFDWIARYAGKDNVLGKRYFRLISDTNPMGMDPTDMAGNDDIVVRSEFHIPKGKEIDFKLASRDVIHSAYMPHFRAQMNCVPGMTTSLHYIPTITTEEMRKDPQVIKNVKEVNEILSAKGEEPYEFNYLLLCNKICGNSHYNMQMNVIVEEPEQYEVWISKQKTVGESMTALLTVPIADENRKQIDALIMEKK
ncbi:MAG: cytochrome c oxidase subunit II [Bacteroidetes bacterium]|nr:MAG: cytochrome c oxidase subunit II [Bacteroidota bacterium]